MEGQLIIERFPDSVCLPGWAKSSTVASALCKSLIQSPAQRASWVKGEVHRVFIQVNAVATQLGTLVSVDRAAISRITPVVRNRIVGRMDTLPGHQRKYGLLKVDSLHVPNQCSLI